MERQLRPAQQLTEQSRACGDEMPTWFQRVENLVIAIATVVAFVYLGFGWWWLLVLFLIFDVSMIGYLVSPAIGAWCYNAVHSYIGPALLGIIAVPTQSGVAAFIALVWAFHIAVDRALGYGLKFTDSFEHTHLGTIGKHKSHDS